MDNQIEMKKFVVLFNFGVIRCVGNVKDFINRLNNLSIKGKLSQLAKNQ